MKQKSSFKKMNLFCYKCGMTYEYQFKLKCNKCLGPIEIQYDYSKVKINNSDNPIKKYFDLLHIPSIEYIHYLNEGNTSLFHAKELGKYLKLDNLYLKLEGENPTDTTKDRMVSVALSYLKVTGIILPKST